VVGRTGYEIFWLACKWAELDWPTKWPTRGGSGRPGSDGRFWQLYFCMWKLYCYLWKILKMHDIFLSSLC